VGLVIVIDVLKYVAANLRNVDKYQPTRHKIPEDVMLERHRCENLRSGTCGKVGVVMKFSCFGLEKKVKPGQALGVPGD
jgi:hypothetical protein